jgi:hypothetical protein
MQTQVVRVCGAPHFMSHRIRVGGAIALEWCHRIRVGGAIALEWVVPLFLDFL